ncbi:unnamed protein product [marine sediment metagenome]|uniref:Uncharacterized protein n=1 Tax=marine sediment metagenome TaxID=412755 RepID=X1BQY4_9ZZZZ
MLFKAQREEIIRLKSSNKRMLDAIHKARQTNDLNYLRGY